MSAIEPTTPPELQPITMYGIVTPNPCPLGEFVREQYPIIPDENGPISVALIHSAIMLELNKTNSRYKRNPEIFLLNAKMTRILEVEAIRGDDIHLQIRRLSTDRVPNLFPGPLCEDIHEDLKPAFMKNPPYDEDETVKINNNILRLLRESTEFCTITQNMRFGEFCEVLRRYIVERTSRNAFSIIDIRGTELAEAWPVDIFHYEQIPVLAKEMCRRLSEESEFMAENHPPICQRTQYYVTSPRKRPRNNNEDTGTSAALEINQAIEVTIETSSDSLSDINAQFSISSMKPKVSEEVLLMPPPRSKGICLRKTAGNTSGRSGRRTRSRSCSEYLDDGEKCSNQVKTGLLFCDECWADKKDRRLSLRKALSGSPSS